MYSSGNENKQAKTYMVAEQLVTMAITISNLSVWGLDEHVLGTTNKPRSSLRGLKTYHHQRTTFNHMFQNLKNNSVLKGLNIRPMT